MDDTELKEEWRRDMLEESRADEVYEREMRTDLDFAFEELGAAEIIEQLEKLRSSLESYGWELSFKELCDYL